MARLREYTRIKHTVLMDIFAKGLLSKREMQIVFVVIRESWGWDQGKSNWTKKALSQRQIAQKTEVNLRHINPVLQDMLDRKILVKNDEGRYSFNEHFETWGVTEKVTKRGVTEKVTSALPKRQHPCYRKGNTNVTEKVTKRILGKPAFSNNLKELRQLTKLSKERFKEIFKETLKEMPSFLRNYYQIKINRKLRVFGETRRKMILNRLENFSLSELMEVVTNISKSDWHMGRDPKTQGAKQNNFELLFRSDVQVEKYLDLKTERKKNGAHKRTSPSDSSKFTKTGYSEIPEPSS